MTDPRTENFDGKQGKDFDALITASSLALCLQIRAKQNQKQSQFEIKDFLSNFLENETFSFPVGK